MNQGLSDSATRAFELPCQESLIRKAEASNCQSATFTVRKPGRMVKPDARQNFANLESEQKANIFLPREVARLKTAPSRSNGNLPSAPRYATMRSVSPCSSIITNSSALRAKMRGRLGRHKNCERQSSGIW